MEGFDGSHASGRFWERHPFLVLVVIALAVRLIIMPFITHDYELYHWALVASNIESGSGLYDLRGYFYTSSGLCPQYSISSPVWTSTAIA